MIIGVKIIHLIPLPFPEHWHTFEDDESSIDIKAVKKFTLILAEFLKQYLSK